MNLCSTIFIFSESASKDLQNDTIENNTLFTVKALNYRLFLTLLYE